MNFSRFLIVGFLGVLQFSVFESNCWGVRSDDAAKKSEGTNDISIFSNGFSTEPRSDFKDSHRGNVNLATISLKDIAKNSKAGQSIDRQIEEINNKSKEDLLELENSIKKMDSDAKTGSDERKVEDLQVILYDMTKEKRYQIQAAYRSAIEVLEKEIRDVVKEIADEKGYSVIMLSDVVVYSTSKCPDITRETIRRLDDRIPEVKVNVSKNPER